MDDGASLQLRRPFLESPSRGRREKGHEREEIRMPASRRDSQQRSVLVVVDDVGLLRRLDRSRGRGRMTDREDQVDATVIGKPEDGPDSGHDRDHGELRPETQCRRCEEHVLAGGTCVDHRGPLGDPPHTGERHSMSVKMMRSTRGSATRDGEICRMARITRILASSASARGSRLPMPDRCRSGKTVCGIGNTRSAEKRRVRHSKGLTRVLPSWGAAYFGRRRNNSNPFPRAWEARPPNDALDTTRRLLISRRRPATLITSRAGSRVTRHAQCKVPVWSRSMGGTLEGIPHNERVFFESFYAANVRGVPRDSETTALSRNRRPAFTTTPPRTASSVLSSTSRRRRIPR